MSVTDLIVRGVMSAVLPMSCLGCDRLIESGRHYVGLCPRCRGHLVKVTGERCGGCGRPLRGASLPAGYRCGACRERPRAYDRLRALWVFKPPLDAVIHGLKFQRLEFLGRQLGRELVRELGRELGRELHSEPGAGLRHRSREAALVTWVPLHWRRYLGRGYNQAQRIAAPLARELGLSAGPTLRRLRATPAQTGLAPGQRAANVKDAFRPRRRTRLSGRAVLLVDDVTTTGSTLDAAAAALRAAGAARITAVAVARTPGKDEPHTRQTTIC